MMQISVKELYQKLNRGVVKHLVDVRSSAEFHSERFDCEGFDVQPLLNHPLDQIDSLALAKDAEIYLTCRSGKRSGQAQARLKELGFSNAINVEGGFMAWHSAGYPQTKTKGQFPIMRQVQIAAGSLVLLGTLGSLFLNPDLIWLSVFVGAGLSFAGLSGWCGMALLLGAMPWNKKVAST